MAGAVAQLNTSDQLIALLTARNAELEAELRQAIAAKDEYGATIIRLEFELERVRQQAAQGDRL